MSDAGKALDDLDVPGKVPDVDAPKAPDIDAPKAPDIDAPKGLDDTPTAFKQDEFASSYDARINQTPAEANPKVQFEGARGESLCKLKPPPDPELDGILTCAGVDGIEYKNGVPDFSPTASAEVEIDHMLGGAGSNGSLARSNNFAQADSALARQLNDSPDLVRQFGFDSGEITSSDVAKYRAQNGLTWHELNDCTTMQLVPSKINSTFGHLGGVGEINAGAAVPGGFVG